MSPGITTLQRGRNRARWSAGWRIAAWGKALLRVICPRLDGWRGPGAAPRLLLGLGLVLLVGCAGMGAWITGWEGTRQGLRFSHARHLNEKLLSCQDCHLQDSEAARYALPDHSVCQACHPIPNETRPEESCQLCHIQRPPAVAVPHTTRELSFPSRQRPGRYNLGEITFSHGKHSQERCEQCHTGIQSALQAHQKHRTDGAPMNMASMSMASVSMSQCMSCHDGKQASAQCETCHSRLPAAWEQRREDSRWPFPHPPQWEQTHGLTARMQQESCQLCHQEQGCETCHQSTEPVDHQSVDWAGGLHGRFALLERERCATCHEQPSCERCHSLPPPSHSPGFMNPTDPAASIAGVQRHRVMAQRDTRACLTCHDFSTDCGLCHSSTRP